MEVLNLNIKVVEGERETEEVGHSG